MALTKAFSEGYGAIAARDDTRALKAAVNTYNEQLRLYGLKDYQVGAQRQVRTARATAHTGRADRREVAREVARAACGEVPLILAGRHRARQV